MPSVLIETGFLTNSSEEKFLASESGQTTIAESIFYAFRDYKNDMENNSGKVSEATVQAIEANMDKEVETPKTEPVTTSTDNKGLTFSVQFYTAESEASATKFADLKPENVTYVKENGLYKYRLGPYKTLDEATKKQTFARNAGYKDAFVIAVKDGKRISIEEAKALAGS